MKSLVILIISLVSINQITAQKLGYYQLKLDETKLYTELLYGERTYFDKGERALMQEFVIYIRANKEKLGVKPNSKANVSARTSFNYVQAADGYYQNCLKDGRLLSFRNYKQQALNFIENKTVNVGTYYSTKKKTELYQKSYSIIHSDTGGLLLIYEPGKKFSYYEREYGVENIVKTFPEGTVLVYDTPNVKIYEHNEPLHSNQINVLRYFVEKYPSSSYFNDAVNYIKKTYPQYLEVQPNEKF